MYFIIFFVYIMFKFLFFYCGNCGNCNVEYLVGVCEYWCCFEVNEVRGKFMFVGFNVECVLNYLDFFVFINCIVLE